MTRALCRCRALLDSSPSLAEGARSSRPSLLKYGGAWRCVVGDLSFFQMFSYSFFTYTMV